MDHYALLGVERMVDPDTLRKAYRTLAKTVHPDLFPLASAAGEAAEARFIAIQAAYEVLSDRALRAAYDATLPPLPKRPLPPTAAAPPPAPAPPPPSRRPTTHSWEVPADPIMRSAPKAPRPKGPPAFMDVLRDATRRRGHELPED